MTFTAQWLIPVVAVLSMNDAANDVLKSLAYGSDAPGCSAAYAVGGQIAWSGVVGTADVEHAVAIRSDTPFDAGSISKSVTALAVLLLERDGRLSLDDPVTKYVTGLPATYEPVRIRHLLSHSSGVRDWQDLLLIMGPFRRDDELRGSDVLAVLRSQRGLNFRPGTRVQYSNSNYVLLGEVVRAASGLSLANFARTRIFEPLGMRHSRIVDDHTAIIRGVAIGHQKNDTGWEVVPRVWDLVGPSDLYATAADLALFLDAIRIPEWHALFTRMEAIATLDGGAPAADDTGRFAGLGFWIRKHDGMTVVGHSGETHGTRAAVYQIREKDQTVAVLCNHNQIDPETAAMRLLDAFTDAGWTKSLDTMPPDQRSGPPRPEERRFAGTYQQPDSRIPYRISATENGLAFGMSRRPLLPLADGSYTLADVPGFRVLFRESGESTHMFLLNGGARDLEPYDRVSTDWQYTPAPADIGAIAGCYVSPELGVAVQLRGEENGSMDLIDPRGRVRKFDAALRDLWRGGFDTLELDRDAKGEVKGFTRSTEIAWRVQYVRRPCSGAPPGAP